jgi:vacuolar protein sorting-associated protein IST1
MYVFNATKTKIQLKLAVNRLKLLQQKKSALNQAARKEIADLLGKGKDESARIRVENIIREDLTVEALELMELYTETLLARFGLLETMRHCDPALSEAVNTVIYASPRIEVPELLQVHALSGSSKINTSSPSFTTDSRPAAGEIWKRIRTRCHGESERCC